MSKKMHLSDLTSATQRGDLVDFRDSKGRLSGYFIWDTNDGKFLTHTTPRGIAQDGIVTADVAQCSNPPSRKTS